MGVKTKILVYHRKDVLLTDESTTTTAQKSSNNVFNTNTHCERIKDMLQVHYRVVTPVYRICIQA